MNAPAVHLPPTPTPYLRALTWAFTLFNTARVLAYLPTLWAVVQSGDVSAHSLVTWFTWTGANCTMALWLYEQGGRRISLPIVINILNAVMCATTATVILAHTG
ncbi:MAG: hypothetical protein ACK5Y1_07745 [Betaproteobacteria bacterium]